MTLSSSRLHAILALLSLTHPSSCELLRDCAYLDTLITGDPLLVNVYQHLDDGALNFLCNTKDCRNTDRFATVDADACSIVCARHSDCAAWNYEPEAAISGDGRCTVVSTNNGTEKADGIVSGTSGCSASSWPECIELDTDVANTGRGEALWFDATVFGSQASLGCSDNDCTYTDKFPVLDAAECGSVCSKVPDCRWWVFGSEDNMLKCWLRLSDMSRTMKEGVVSGSHTCGSFAPVRKQTWTRANSQCWSGGFSAELCCDQKYGTEGNPACWDSYHTFGFCCLGEDKKVEVYEA